MTKLAVPITASQIGQAIADVRLSPTAGADVVEIRLDHVDTTEYAGLVKNSQLAILWTLRHCSEGGNFCGSVDEQIERLAYGCRGGRRIC